MELLSGYSNPPSVYLSSEYCMNSFMFRRVPVDGRWVGEPLFDLIFVSSTFIASSEFYSSAKCCSSY